METNRICLLLIVCSFNMFATAHKPSTATYKRNVEKVLIAACKSAEKVREQHITTQPTCKRRGGKGIIFPDIIIPQND